MIDYWEAVGRLATYKTLNDRLVKVLPPPGAMSPVSVPFQGGTAAGFDIPQTQYDAVQQFLNPVLTEGYLSLMSAGEIIWTYSFQQSREAMQTLPDVIARATPEVFGPSTRYFITLGILIVDEIFRHNLQKADSEGVKALQLADSERDKIANLAKISEFETMATDFSKSPWAGGCNVRLCDWEGHLHPPCVDAVEWHRVKKTRRAAG